MNKITSAVRAHPFISGFMVACIVVGAAAGSLFLPPEWHPVRRLAAGIISGAGCGLIIVATRIVGP